MNWTTTLGAMRTTEFVPSIFAHAAHTVFFCAATHRHLGGEHSEELFVLADNVTAVGSANQDQAVFIDVTGTTSTTSVLQLALAT